MVSERSLIAGYLSDELANAFGKMPFNMRHAGMLMREVT